MSDIIIRVDGLQEFVRVFQEMPAEAQISVRTMLDGAGMKLLDTVQNVIISMAVVDTRRLLNSFDKGGDGNVWTVSNGGLTLTIGTNVSYAAAVNDGYRPVTSANASGRLKDGTLYRWIPGMWNGNKFEYSPGAKTGMMLKEQFIPAKPYWDVASNMFNTVFETEFGIFFDAWVERWRSRGGFE